MYSKEEMKQLVNEKAKSTFGSPSDVEPSKKSTRAKIKTRKIKI
jgi:hypothetical protein